MRRISVDPQTGPFSLARTCAPVWWGRGRWPNVDWIDGGLVWVGWENGRVVWRRAVPSATGATVEGTGDSDRDAVWAEAVLGTGSGCPRFDDPVVDACRRRLAGLRPFAAGSLFDGLVAAIVGQSISVAAAAITQARLAALVSPAIDIGGRRFWPLPSPEGLATAEPSLIRQSGVTWRRAEALVAAGRRFADETWHDARSGALERDPTLASLRRLPLVGPWTAESTLLWGLGQPDAYPAKDAALLRAARAAYRQPNLSHAELDRFAEGWRPARGWAARLLWTSLLGVPEG